MKDSVQIMQWSYWKCLQDCLKCAKVTFLFHTHSCNCKKKTSFIVRSLFNEFVSREQLFFLFLFFFSLLEMTNQKHIAWPAQRGQWQRFTFHNRLLTWNGHMVCKVNFPLYIMLFIHVVSTISKHKYPLPLHFPLIRCLNQWFSISVTHRPPPQHVKG